MPADIPLARYHGNVAPLTGEHHYIYTVTNKIILSFHWNKGGRNHVYYNEND